MVSVDRQILITQICKAYGAEGKKLESMRARLSLMDEHQLMFVHKGINKVKNIGLGIEKTNNSAINTPPLKQELSEEQANDFSIQTIEDNISAAEKIVSAQDLGIVSKGFDYLKQKDFLGNKDISTENVKEVIANQKLGVQNLKYAKDGALSKRDYYLQNKERLKEMIIRRLYTIDSKSGNNFIDRNKGNYTKEQFAEFLEKYINTTVDKIQSMDSIKTMQHTLVIADEAKESDFLNKLLQNANKNKNKPNFNSLEGKGIEIASNKVPIEFDTVEAIKFEEVYKYERGTEYSKDSIERYKQASDEMNFVTGAYNSLQKYDMTANKLLKDYNEAKKVYTDTEGNSHGGVEPSAATRKNQFLEFYNSYYSLKEDKGKSDLKKLVEQSKLPIELIEKKDGSYDINLSKYQNVTQKNRALNSLLRLGKQNQKELFEKLLNGKSLESYQSKYESNFAAALGVDNAEELSQAMKEDNMSAIQRYAGNTAVTGMVLMVAGGILTAVPVTTPIGMTLMGIGQVGALGGMAARNVLGFADAFTRDSVSPDELKELLKELAMDVGGFIIGGVAGKKGLQYGGKILTQSKDKVAGFIAEKGTDFTLSLAGDLAMMGILNSSDTSESLTQGNLIGIVVSTVTGISSAKYSNMKSNAHKSGTPAQTPKTDITGIKPKNETIVNKPQIDEEIVAPFAERVLNEPQIGETVIPDKSRIEIENGSFNKDGEFLPDGTFTRTENHPFAKSKTIKPTPWGYMKIAENYKDLEKQIIQNTELSPKEAKYQVESIKTLIKNNPELNIADVSEMIIDIKLLDTKKISSLISGYDGLSKVENFSNFKENLSNYANMICEMKKNSQTDNVGNRLSDIRMEYLTKNMPKIEPEEFKKNLEYFKSLDNKLQNGTIQYDYDILFDVHNGKYIERLDAAKDYNKYLAEKHLDDIQIGHNAYNIISYSDERFELFKENMNLAKELYEKKLIHSDGMNKIAFSYDTNYLKSYEKLNKELPEEKQNSVVWNVMKNRFSDNTRAQDTTIEMFKHMDTDILKKVCECDDNYELFNHIGSLDEAGCKNLILKTQILEKMPQLGQYRKNTSYYAIAQFLKDYKIENPEKVMEFINLAEPAYLSHINVSNYDQAYYDFDKIFNKGNLDLMIDNAKLIQELPKGFRDYLNSDKSMAAQNFNNRKESSVFDYTSDAKEFGQRVETIKKYNGKLSEYQLERLYNGSLKVENKVLDALSAMDPKFSHRIVSYNYAETLNNADPETLAKFTKVINSAKNSSDEEIYSFISNIDDDSLELYKNLTENELNALSFKILSRVHPNLNNIERIKESINLVPETIRNIIKEDVSDLYFRYESNPQNKAYVALINSLDKMNEEDLKNIGSKPLAAYLSQNYNIKSFNQNNLNSWKKVSPDIKNKLGTKGLNLLTSEDNFDINLLNSRVQNLINNGVFENITDQALYTVITNTSNEMDTILNNITSDKFFRKETTSFLISKLNAFKETEGSDLDFVNKLKNNPKTDVNEIATILSPISSIKEIGDKQQDFALYLLDRGDVDNKIVSQIISHIDNHKYDKLANKHINAPINKLIENFAKDLLDNPNIKNENIPSVLKLLRDEKTFDAKKDLALDIINSKKYNIREITDRNGFGDARVEFTKFLVNENSLKEQAVYSILSNTPDENQDSNAYKNIQHMIKEVLDDNNYDNIDFVALTNAISSDARRADIQTAFIKELCRNKDIAKCLIPNIVKVTTNDTLEFAKEMCNNKDFLKHKIANIIGVTKKENLEFAEQLYHDKTIPMEDFDVIISSTNQNIKNKDLINEIYLSEDFPNNRIKDIVQYISAGKKENFEKAESILSTPSLKQWTGKNLENGIDIEILPDLLRTQKKLYEEAEKAANSKKVTAPSSENTKLAAQEAKPAEIAKAEETLVNLGVHTKMAPNYVKMCQQNGIVDKVKLDAVCALAQSGVPVNEIKNIFNLATGNALSSMNGQFRPDIIKDIVAYKQNGIDDIKFAANLAAVKNMSIVEFKGRLNTKIREDLINRINALPDAKKEKIKSSGTDLDKIIEKAYAEPKAGKVKQADVAQIHLRSLDNIVGVEKLILNKYKNEIDQNIWGDEKRFKAWAEEKLKKVLDFKQNPNYTAVDEYAKFNDARKEGIESWYKYLKEESNYKDDVFVQLLVMEGITKDMKPNNANTPPAVSHESFEATYNALLENNTSVSFSKIYAQQTKLKAINQFCKKDVSLDGIEGKWITIPQSKKSDPEHNNYVAMVQALSEGSSWCLRFENAHNYLAQGNLHFFVDKNGNSQVAINETDRTITQIQKRYDQNSTVPIPYSKVIDNWVKENKYKGHEAQIKSALYAKPNFDNLKNKLAGYEASGDYLSIFKELNINVTTAPDGTYVLSAYKPKVTNQYTLFDLGINENKLMQNVSEINSDLDLNGSVLTALPMLRIIKGKLSFGDNQISDLRNLEKINGKKFIWDK